MTCLDRWCDPNSGGSMTSERMVVSIVRHLTRVFNTWPQSAAACPDLGWDGWWGVATEGEHTTHVGRSVAEWITHQEPRLCRIRVIEQSHVSSEGGAIRWGVQAMILQPHPRTVTLASVMKIPGHCALTWSDAP